MSGRAGAGPGSAPGLPARGWRVARGGLVAAWVVAGVGLAGPAAAEKAAVVVVLPFSVGDVVASEHMVAGCPKMDVAVGLNADPQFGAAVLAKMAAAQCQSIAAETRVRVLDVLDSGVVRISPVGTGNEAVFALGRDFRLIGGR